MPCNDRRRLPSGAVGRGVCQSRARSVDRCGTCPATIGAGYPVPSDAWPTARTEPAAARRVVRAAPCDRPASASRRMRGRLHGPNRQPRGGLFGRLRAIDPHLHPVARPRPAAVCRMVRVGVVGSDPYRAKANLGLAHGLGPRRCAAWSEWALSARTPTGPRRTSVWHTARRHPPRCARRRNHSAQAAGRSGNRRGPTRRGADIRHDARAAATIPRKLPEDPETAADLPGAAPTPHHNARRITDSAAASGLGAGPTGMPGR